MPGSSTTPKAAFHWVEIALAGLAVVLALLTSYQSYANRSLQAGLAEGQAKLTRAQTLANLDNNLIQLMAKTAVENNDGAIRDLLARNGVTLNAKPAAQAPVQPAATAPAPEPKN